MLIKKITISFKRIGFIFHSRTCFGRIRMIWSDQAKMFGSGRIMWKLTVWRAWCASWWWGGRPGCRAPLCCPWRPAASHSHVCPAGTAAAGRQWSAPAVHPCFWGLNDVTMLENTPQPSSSSSMISTITTSVNHSPLCHKSNNTAHFTSTVPITAESSFFFSQGRKGVGRGGESYLKLQCCGAGAATLRAAPEPEPYFLRRLRLHL